MVKVLTFEAAIKDSEKYKKRHLLLGNGFSIACRPKIFTYGSLFEQADFSSVPELPAVFKALGTTDFEQVIKTLEDASRALPVYGAGLKPTAKAMKTHAAKLKDILIKTVADNHPSVPNDVDDMQFWGCRQFLANFLSPSNDGRVYTLNYDLLLYWTMMHDDMPFGDPIDLNHNDGFGRDDDTDPEYVTWMGEGSARDQRVHYLHGALHLFDAGADLQKYTWVNTGIPLLEQARAALDAGKFPLFVAEGESRQKLAKIKHSAYLYHSFKSFSQQMLQANDVLFIFGHSLAANDDHVLKKIARGKIPKVYVGLHGAPDKDSNKKIIQTARALAQGRPDRFPLEVAFFDSESAGVWEYSP